MSAQAVQIIRKENALQYRRYRTMTDKFWSTVSLCPECEFAGMILKGKCGRIYWIRGKERKFAEIVSGTKSVKTFLYNRPKGYYNKYVADALCRCSSLVEHQLPKLRRRVRFPSSAYRQNSRKLEGFTIKSRVYGCFYGHFYNLK